MGIADPGTGDLGDFNKEWAELKHQAALREDAQERQAFMEGI